MCGEVVDAGDVWVHVAGPGWVSVVYFDRMSGIVDSDDFFADASVPRAKYTHLRENAIHLARASRLGGLGGLGSLGGAAAARISLNLK